MQCLKVNCLNFNYKDILIDEIALEGLEGIGLRLLWARLSHRLSYDITEKLKHKLWAYIVKSSSLEIYNLTEPATYFEIRDRFMMTNKSTGNMLAQDFYFDGPFNYKLVPNEFGSCYNFNTRTLIQKSDITALNYEEIVDRFGETLVIVASLQQRWHALASHSSFNTLDLLKPVTYAILELIGKGRENGQMTVGQTNLLKISVDPKILFYHRNKLEELDLITSLDTMQHITDLSTNRGFKSILLRLTRFYKPKMLSIQKEGVLYDIREHLLKRPGNRDCKLHLVQNGIVSQRLWKSLTKRTIFQFNEQADSPKANKYNSIKLPSDTEESVDSDDEGPTLTCKQKIGVNIYKQAYDTLLDSGLEGLSQIELGQILGLGFYTTRTIIRYFTNRNFLRIFSVDQGKQKTRKYALRVTTGESVKIYAKEKEKLLSYLDTSVEIDNEQSDNSPTIKRKADETNIEKTHKKPRLEEKPQEIGETPNIRELHFCTRQYPNLSMRKSLSDIKSPSLRQLQIANAILKVTREQEIVESRRTLNLLVNKEIGFPHIEIDTLKRYLSKLSNDKQLRYYAIRWPNFHDKTTLLICAPHVTKDHPKVIEFHNKVLTQASKKLNEHVAKKTKVESKNKLFNETYSLYLKIQKLHEFLYNLVYTNPDNVELNNKHLPEGFVSLGIILQEMNLELAVGHLSVMKIHQLSDIDVKEIDPQIKMKDAPKHLSQTIMYSKSYTTALKNSIEMLASIGLLQVCFQTDRILNSLDDKMNHILYINRHAKFIDTRGLWPTAGTEPEKLFEFYFETQDDVLKYWELVYDVSVSTKIETLNRKAKATPTIPIRTINEVQKHDNGDILGDGCGPAGFHSKYHTDIMQLWQPYKIASWKIAQAKLKPKLTAPLTKKNLPKVKKVARERKKKVVVKKEKAPIILSKKKLTRLASTITWSEKHDDILLWSKVAINIMSPVPIAGSIQITNFVAKDLINITGVIRTVSQCVKRGQILEKNASFGLRQRHLVNELRRHKSVLAKYDGILKKIRTKHMGNLSKYMNEGRVRCLELVFMMQKLSISTIMRNQVPPVASTIDEFHQKFMITSTDTQKYLSLYATPEECSPDISTIKEGIILVLCIKYASSFTSAMSTKVFNTFSGYAERSLRFATEQLHKSGAVSIRDKFTNNRIQKAPYTDIIQYTTGYKISSFYQRRWIHRFNDIFLDNLTQILENSTPTNNIKPSSEMTCFLSELLARNSVKIIPTQLPTMPIDVAMEGSSFPLLDMEMKTNFKPGNTGWSNKGDVTNMKDLYKNIDYGAAVRELIRHASVEFPKEENVPDDIIVNTLNNAGVKGKTFKELLKITKLDSLILQRKLKELEAKFYIKRVGYNENILMSSKYLKDWCIKIDNSYFIPSPWFHLRLQIMYPIFIDWCSAIMNKIFENPGSSVSTIAQSLNYITLRSVQEICMLFYNCECVVLKTLSVIECNLFSDDDDNTNLIDFNEYESPDLLMVFPVKDYMLKFVNFRKNVEQFCMS